MPFDRVDVVRPAELAPDDRAAWLACATRESAFATGFLHPDFAVLIDTVREDARVAVVRRAGEAIGFLAFHRRPDGVGRPLGAPFSDVHGLVCAPTADLSLPDVLRAAGLTAYRATGWIDPQARMDAQEMHWSFAHQVAIDAPAPGAPSFLEERAKRHPKHFKTARRLRRRAGEAASEDGGLAFEFDTRAPDDLARLLSWKSAQYRASGRHDVLAPAWTKAFLEMLFCDSDAAVRLQISRLSLGGAPIAYEANLRCGDNLHGWLVAYDPAWSKVSPGLLLMQDIIAAAPEHGVRVYDLGPDGDHYKRFYANSGVSLADGLIGAAGPAGQARLWGSRLVRAVEAHAPPRLGALTGRVRRRADHIAASEPDWAGRMRGAAQAVRGLQSRRAAPSQA